MHSVSPNIQNHNRIAHAGAKAKAMYVGLMGPTPEHESEGPIVAVY